MITNSNMVSFTFLIMDVTQRFPMRGEALCDDPNNSCEGEQGWHSDESAHLPPMCPRFDSRIRRHMWAEFVGSLLCSERFFSENSGFPISTKTNI